jgi:hypothetical protein
MTEMSDELPDIHVLTSTEVSAIGGGFNNMGPLMAAGAAVLRFLDDINLRFYGCVTEDGTTRCVYSYDP